MPALERTEKLLWVSLLLLVPMTASPLLPFGAGTLVRPLCFLPALMLLALAGWRVLALRQRWTLPRDGAPWLAAFVLYTLVSGLMVVATLPQEPFKGQTPLDSFVRALATLGFGLVFFFVARLQLRSLGDVRLALRWLFIGMAASVAFAVLQTFAMVHGGTALRLVQALTDLIALHYDGLKGRAQGLTYEPSWLAVQILVLLLPPLVARIVSGQAGASLPAGSRNITIALGGLGVALAGLLCAGSRIGLIGAIAMLLLAGLLALLRGRLVMALLFIGALAAGGAGAAALSSLGTGAGGSYVLGPLRYVTDPTSALTDDTNFTTATDIFALGARAAASGAAFEMWWTHPWTGVSLGNGYRYFGRYSPDWAFETHIFDAGTYEGANWLDPNSPAKGNAKNLILRLLAETGLPGLLLFGLFIRRQLFAAPARDAYYAAFRLALLAALFFSAVNQDSFAEPAPWIMLVLAATMGRLQGREAALHAPLALGAIA